MDWPPPTRRNRTTRREQNLALLGAVVSGAVIAGALLLLLSTRIDPAQGGKLRGAAADLVVPVWSVVRLPFDWLGSGLAAAGEYIGAASRNRRLEAELRDQRAALQQQAVLADENRRLRSLLKVVDPERRPVATARIAGASSGSYVRSAMISAGRGDGVAVGQPVRVADGLVGRTIEAGDHGARVLLLSDSNSRVPVTVVRTGQPALAVGANGPLLEIRDRVGAEVPLLRGDRLVTSGDGGIFPPGIPVATIVDGGREPALARPAVNPAGMGLVLIEAPYLPVTADTVVAVNPVPVPREAGGGRRALPVTSTTPRAVASAATVVEEPAPAPVATPDAKPPPPLRYTPKAMPRYGAVIVSDYGPAAATPQ